MPALISKRVGRCVKKRGTGMWGSLSRPFQVHTEYLKWFLNLKLHLIFKIYIFKTYILNSHFEWNVNILFLFLCFLHRVLRGCSLTPSIGATMGHFQQGRCAISLDAWRPPASRESQCLKSKSHVCGSQATVLEGHVQSTPLATDLVLVLGANCLEIRSKAKDGVIYSLKSTENALWNEILIALEFAFRMINTILKKKNDCSEQQKSNLIYTSTSTKFMK